jgi:hypothetical protein
MRYERIKHFRKFMINLHQPEFFFGIVFVLIKRRINY